MTRAGVATMLAMLGGLPGHGMAADAASGRSVCLRVVPHASLDATSLVRAEASVRALFGTAGVRVSWCGAPRDNCATVTDASAQLVLLLPFKSSTDGEVCGAVTRDPNTRVPTVVVFVPCIAEQASAIRSSLAGRSHPALARLQPGDLVGLTIAHEVGHVLGLPHAHTGVMQARFDLDDVLAFQSVRLGFLPTEAARMQSQLLSRAEETGSQ